MKAAQRACRRQTEQTEQATAVCLVTQESLAEEKLQRSAAIISSLISKNEMDYFCSKPRLLINDDK